MNKITAFRNAQEFNEIFGLLEHGNGVKSRRNSILLAFYKSKSIWDYCKKHNCYKLFFSITNMSALKSVVMEKIHDELYNITDKPMWPVQLMSETYWSDTFETDECYGIPSNGAIGFVRYKTHEKNRDGKVYRMRAGKFFKRILLGSELGQALPQQVLNWLCEQFTEEWSSYVTRKMPHFELRVDDNFERIYSYSEPDGCTDEFKSCMMDDNQWIFYKDSVQAKAASLVNDEGRIIARCVIFTNVKDEDGKVWRLAERQYAENGRDMLKRCLVDALIEGGHIDGYKMVGADCHSTRAYVDVHGNTLIHKKFWIDCDLDMCSNEDEAYNTDECKRVLSYQDSFKYYDTKLRKAFNHEPSDMKSVKMLDTTDCYVYGCWDEYHQRITAYTVSVWVHGKCLSCDHCDLDDFKQYKGTFFHVDDFVECPHCGRPMPDPELYSAEADLDYFNGSYVCSRSCRMELEEAYHRDCCFFDKIRRQFVNREQDNPVNILYLKFGVVQVWATSEKRLGELLDCGTIKLAELNDEVVPVYGYGINNATRRLNDYIRECGERVIDAANDVIRDNRINGVEKSYTKALAESGLTI